MMMNAIQNASDAFFPNKARTAPTISRALYIIALSLSLWLICITQAEALILTVRQDGGGQYSTIQSAINNAQNGDTVLVFPGRYYENIDFIGKSITVCSREATTNDSTYISRTIIDGNNSGSCVVFRNQEQNAVLRGFTLEHGSGYRNGLRDYVMGGGIYIWTQCSISVVECNVTNNRSTYGAGVYIDKSTVSLSGVNIYNNYATTLGAGLYVYSHPSYLTNIMFDQASRCSIYSNYSGPPCDIAIIDLTQNLDIFLDRVSVPVLSSFYYQRFSNFMQSQGFHDTIHSLRAHRLEINHDMYVSPLGSDTNSGLTPDDAMRSITKAVHRIASDSLDIKTVYVLPGSYSEGNNDQIFPIPGKSHVRIKGSSSSECILYTDKTYSNSWQYALISSNQRNITFSGFKLLSDYDPLRIYMPVRLVDDNATLSDLVVQDCEVAKSGVISIHGYATTVNIDNIRILNVVTKDRIISIEPINGCISNCIINNVSSTLSSPDGWAGTLIGISIRDSLRIENCVFQNISVVDLQATMYLLNTNQDDRPMLVTISNSIFDNIHTGNSHAIGLVNGNINPYTVSNCTFINNTGDLGAIGLLGRIRLTNNVLYNPDSDHELCLLETSPWGLNSEIYMLNNYLRGGQSSILNPYSNNIVYYGDTNIDSDPAFVSLDPEDRQYAHLSGFSPCIDSGTPDISELGLLPYDLDGRIRVWNGRIDMGCYEYGSEPYVVNDDPVVVPPPTTFGLCNYPNPFNPITTIRFELPRDSLVLLSIYNLKGQKVTELISSYLRSGKHQTVWNGTDSRGNPVASGVYYYRLSAGDESEISKMMLIK